MATKREKFLATCLSTLISELKDNGLEFTDAICMLEPELKEIIEEPDELPKVGKTADEKYYYTGVDQVTMTQEQRNALGICEFTVTYHGETLLRIYWDVTLNWIMQPSEDGNSFVPVAKRKFPGKDFARSFLKKLADKEREKPGSFADTYYMAKPTVYVRNTTINPIPTVQAEVA